MGSHTYFGSGFSLRCPTLWTSYLMAIVLCVATSASVADAQERVFRPEDLFRLEALGPVVISPDEAHIAYVRLRPKQALNDYSQDRYTSGAPRSDVWVIMRGGEPRNLTHGDADSSGWFAPQWSPDGERLLLASTRGDIVTLWMWEPGDDAPREFVPRSIDPTATAWLAGGAVVTVMRGNGTPWRKLAIDTRAARTAMRAWPLAWAGRAPTASVVRSPVPIDVQSRAQDSLVVVDKRGNVRAVASGVGIVAVRPSPNGRYVAFLRAKSVVRPDTLRPLLHMTVADGKFNMELAIVDVATGRLVAAPTSTVPDVDPRTLAWSADSRRVAVMTYGGDLRVDRSSLVACTAPMTSGISMLSCDTVVDSIPAVDSGPLAPLASPRLFWSGETIIFWRNPSFSARFPGRGSRRYDWYAATPQQPLRPLTGEFDNVPSLLVPERVRPEIRAAVVGVADGRLWRLYMDGTRETIPVADDRRIFSIAAVNSVGGQGTARLIVNAAADDTGQTATYLVDLAHGTATVLPAPPIVSATLAAASPHGSTLVYTATTDTGMFAWVRDAELAAAGAAPKPVAALNTFLRDVTPGTFQSFRYRTAKGDSVTGWVLLPPGHRSGMRHPAVVWVYPGIIYGDAAPAARLSRVWASHPLNAQLYAAHGYAVVFPSMPFENKPPYAQFLDAILPGVDAAVRVGLVDSARVAIAGHSYGGYVTYAVITQTDRFKAAIAMAGPTELISNYGTFYSGTRYTDTPQDMNLARFAREPWGSIAGGDESSGSVNR